MIPATMVGKSSVGIFIISVESKIALRQVCHGSRLYPVRMPRVLTGFTDEHKATGI